MKAYRCNQAILCPDCGQVMRYDRDTKIVWCVGRACDLKGIKYHAPSVELEPVDKPNKVEYVICQVEIDE